MPSVAIAANPTAIRHGLQHEQRAMDIMKLASGGIPTRECRTQPIACNLTPPPRAGRSSWIEATSRFGRLRFGREAFEELPHALNIHRFGVEGVHGIGVPHHESAFASF